jgi:GDPmannose 4,6-dehydratase
MRALIVGCRGQDGSYLWEQLAEQNAVLLGIDSNGGPQTCGFDWTRSIDITQIDHILAAVAAFQPDEIYYLAAYHHSSQESALVQDQHIMRRSQEVHVLGLEHVLRALKQHAPHASLVYAASSQVFGAPKSELQTEDTPLAPDCVYGVTKVAGMLLARHYRREFGIRASAAILYNHESPRRAEKFVSQRIIHGLIRVKNGQQQHLVLGDLSAAVDWGYAPDYTRAMQLIARAAPPDDYIIATGELHTVGEMACCVCEILGLDPTTAVLENPNLLYRRGRPLCGDSSKLRKLTDWNPQKNFRQMLDTMVVAALRQHE